MSGLRQFLLDKNWRQGTILNPHAGCMKHSTANGFIVLNQTCDCISDDLENEPFFEVLPFVRLPEGPDPLLINSRNARRIHFQLDENTVNAWVSARIADIEFIPRSRHEELTSSKDFLIPSDVLGDLIAWRAAKYLRTAFPDGFEKALSKPLIKIGKILKKHEDLIDRLLIGLEPETELSDGEQYEVRLRLMVTPGIYVESEKFTTLHQIAQEIEGHLRKVERFDAPTCVVQSLADMSLWEYDEYFDFSRYDYLSFGKEEDAPEN